MTSHEKDNMKTLSESNSDPDQQQKSFHVTLIDIRRAVMEKEIYCVEKPLVAGQDLEFIAISYRWGEVQEQTVNTNVGYLANVTSFHMEDFYFLCKMMTKEPDLKSMKYVWVDVICVDQANYERRKATVHRMSDIYKSANYIVAVPDLQRKYLTSINTANIQSSYYLSEHSNYIYHLIHGNANELVKINEAWLDKINVPKDRALRRMLAKDSSRLFVNSFEKYKNDDAENDPEDALVHLQNAVLCSNGYQDNHMGDGDWPHCVLKEIKKDQWKLSIAKRLEEISQAMNYLAFLIKEWSTRTWVISEYHIAKTKISHKMKYWFVSLHFLEITEFGFFEFDFSSNTMVQQNNGSSSSPPFDNENNHRHSMENLRNDNTLSRETYQLYRSFQNTMVRQLKQQAFLEMMLKSKSSRNEDKFYAILPSSKYSDKLESKDIVDSWGINTMVSVKLKLYEWMDINDKLVLLFLSAAHYSNSGVSFLFPTFATLDTIWRWAGVAPFEDDTHQSNFDMTNSATITFNTIINFGNLTSNDVVPHYKLNLRPNMFYSLSSNHLDTSFIWFLNKYKRQWQQLQVDIDNDLCSLVCIPRYTGAIIKRPDLADLPVIYFVGCMEKNKWIVSTFMIHLYDIKMNPEQWTVHYSDCDCTGFDIY